jgi:HSP20 family protein
MPGQKQALPVRMYQTKERLMLAAPMPGLEPSDISVTVEGDRIIIRGDERGPHQHERDMLIAEWTIGPYYREVDLIQPVNGALTNATYDNGVLVVSMPKMEPGQRGVPAEIQLEPVHATRGEHVGHTGRDIQPTSTEEHRDAKLRAAREA